MQDDTIDVHIRSATRPDVETERLLRDLVAYSWPRGIEDQSDGGHGNLPIGGH